MHRIEPCAPYLPRRASDTNKYDYGRVLIVGGCVGYTGAPTLCAHAALRCGAGLVSVGVPEAIYAITAVKNDAAMPFPLPSADGKLTADALPELLERLEFYEDKEEPLFERYNVEDAIQSVLKRRVDLPNYPDDEVLVATRDALGRQVRAWLLATLAEPSPLATTARGHRLRRRSS